MKIKSLMMLAMVGFVAASMTYVTPALAADDMSNNNDQNMQAPSDTQMPNPSMPSSNNNSSNDNGNTPDTATGDDDY